MSNSIRYNSDVAAEVLNELTSIGTELEKLSSTLSKFAEAQPASTTIDYKIEKMAEKYDEEGQSYTDEADERYYRIYYGNPLKLAKTNITNMASKVGGFVKNVSSVSTSISTIQGAVEEFEEINPIPEEAKDIITESVTTKTDHSYVNFGGISENAGIGKADVNIDLNGDGVPDINIDINGDGKADINIDLNGDGVPDTNIDTNGDGKADLNIDLNRDGIPDVNVDVNGDGKADINIDINGDGRPDLNIDLDGDGKADLNIDLDGDGKPDVNEDTNGDGEADTNVDTNEDGKKDTNVDTDGDGKVDTNIDTNGDGVPDVNIDLDGDGKPDVNIDTNNDGRPDLNIDTDGDGIADTNIDANGNGIIDSLEKKEPEQKPTTPATPKPEEGKEDEPVTPDPEPTNKEEKEEEESLDDLIDLGKVVIPDIEGESVPTGDVENKGATAIGNIGTAIADSITSVEDELLDSVITDEKGGIPDALLGNNLSNGMSQFDASGSYKNAQGPAAQAGVGVAGVAALGVAAASGGTAISGILEEKNDDPETRLADDELTKRKRIRTIITSASLVVLSLGFTLTQVLRPDSLITILLFGIAILISAVASIFGTNIGKTITTITSMLLLLTTFLLSALGIVSPLGYIIALISLLTIFLIVYIFDLFNEFVDNKIMIPSFTALVALNAFGLLKVFNVVNWLVYLLLAGLGIAVYLWYEKYYGQGFEVLERLKKEDKHKFFN